MAADEGQPGKHTKDQGESVHLIYVIAIVVASALGGFSGWHLKANFTKPCPEPVEQVQPARQYAKAAEKQKAEVRIVEKEIVKIVREPFYAGSCLDDAGLLLVNKAVTTTAAGASLDGSSGTVQVN